MDDVSYQGLLQSKQETKSNSNRQLIYWAEAQIIRSGSFFPYFSKRNEE